MNTLEEDELCFPQLLNSSCRKIVRPHAISILIYITLSAISLITVTLNLLVIISISHFKQLHNPTNILLLSLGVSDFFVGLLFLFQIMLIDGCWFLSDQMCALYVVLDYIITSASIGTMVLISVDRYVAICDPLHYHSKVTEKRAKICVTMCWIGAALCHSLLLRGNLQHPGRYNSCSGECVVVVDYIGGFIDLCVSFIGPVTVIVVLYVRVFAVVVSQARAMRSHIAAVTLQDSLSVKSEMKAARTLGVVVVVFLICVCPYFCVTLTGHESLVNVSTTAFVMCLFYLNSCLNPLIYALFYPWFRKSIKLIVTLQILVPGSCETSIV
ncbi:trace amine-associated receptor 13c-like [Parambassis ranga]|uniref:Trace amine-associated receptor 13c-like n=1 Tax=Parambassis ranga TaxID=210632 RepID=A0A6P7HBA4_9TELE|nr:trace amine-associated receptor 13c-like [Parambassis ranga]